MCTRLSHKYGYICDDCFEELIKLGILTDIDMFLKTEPDNPFMDLNITYFDSIFPKQR